MSRSRQPPEPQFDPSDLPAPICEFCGEPITEDDQECMAFDPGERRCSP